MEIIIRATEKEYDRAGEMAFNLSEIKDVVRVRVTIVDECDIMPARKMPTYDTSRRRAMIEQNEYALFRNGNSL